MRTVFGTTLMMLALLGLADPAAQAPARRSTEMAPEFRALLEAKHLDVFAAPDPDARGRYVAVMSFSGTQLLVVSARYPEPSLMERRLEAGQFRDAYMDLQCVADTAGKWFIEDMGADGLRAARERDLPFDIVFKDGADYVVLDGDWQRQKLSDTEYRSRFDKTEAEYVRMLTILSTAIKNQS